MVERYCRVALSPYPRAYLSRVRRISRAGTTFVALIAIGCVKGEVQSGTVRIICGGNDRPCNFRIVAPSALEQATLAVDGIEQLPLMPHEMEHPVRNLLLRVLGASPRSSAAVAILYLSPGSHSVRITKLGLEPITKTVTIGSGNVRLAIHSSDLKPEKPAPTSQCIE